MFKTQLQIDQYLDENKRLIWEIMKNQSLGKAAECAQYEAQLQQNLIYLAAVADAQPQAPFTTQNPLQSVVQQEHHTQQPQSETAQQQLSVLTPNMPFHLNALQLREQQHPQFLQQQHTGMIPGANARMQQYMQIGNSGFWGEARRGSRQDLLETGSGGSQGGNAAFGHLTVERNFHL